MRKILFAILLLTIFMFPNCKAGNPSASDNSIVNLTYDSFKQKVSNIDASNQWNYKGNKPAIIDFYANWCGPCRRLAPILDEVAKEYTGKILVYKVDVDAEQTLSAKFGIRSLPTLLFIPITGQPQASEGLLTKDMLVKAVNEILLQTK